MNGKQITELATNGRTIYSYVQLTPGAAGLTPDTQLPVPVGGNGNISFNGNRSGHNLYLLDGGENSDRGGAASSSVMPSIDALAETQNTDFELQRGLRSFFRRHDQFGGEGRHANNPCFGLGIFPQ